MASDNRCRSWRFLLYPESCNPEWQRILEDEFNVTGFVSPLHDPDPLEGELKLHRHCILRFEGKKSFDQVEEIVNAVGGVMYKGKLAHRAKVTDIRGAVRYLVHYDCKPDPDTGECKQKWQDPESQIIGLCGEDASCYFDMTSSEIDEALSEMRSIIRRFNIKEYAQFADWCDIHNSTFAHMLNTRYSNVISLYITSRRHSPKIDIDPETGKDTSIIE